METLTYNYGETPEEVIEGSAAKLRNSDGFIELEYGGEFHDAATFTNSKDLLTVLDALHRSDFPFSWGDGAAADKARRDRSRQLRISILSALGIEES